MNNRGAGREDQAECGYKKESEPDVLANLVREPQAAQSPPHLVGSRPDLLQRLNRTDCDCVLVRESSKQHSLETAMSYSLKKAIRLLY